MGIVEGHEPSMAAPTTPPMPMVSMKRKAEVITIDSSSEDDDDEAEGGGSSSKKRNTERLMKRMKFLEVSEVTFSSLSFH